MNMESVSLIDVVIVSLFTVSILIGLYRGLMRETITLFVWTIAAVLAVTHGPKLGSLLVFLPSPTIQKYVGGITIFVLIVFIGLVAKIMGFKYFAIRKPIGIDRFLGAIFGAFRAWVVIVLALVLLDSTSMKDDPNFQHSRTAPYFYWAVDMIDQNMPKKWKKKPAGTDITNATATDTTPTTTVPLPAVPTKEEVITPNNKPIPDVTQSAPENGK